MAYLQTPKIPKSPKRSNKDYVKSSHSELINHLKTQVKKPGHTIGDFFAKSFWKWIYHYIKNRFGPNFPYPAYKNSDTGIYQLNPENEISIAVTSDWATDTADSFAIAHQMGTHNPDYTIHVGDTYYVGAPQEIKSNFVEPGSPWIRGSSGSFAVLGNHEMYARGNAFFEHLLPTLGIKNTNGLYEGQKAGFFCLQNDHWRILGLDTGYHSVGTPVIEFIPGLGPGCRFDKKQMEWLKKTVNLGDKLDKRGILVLTHHQVISAFRSNQEYTKPVLQLTSLVGSDRSVLWLWGHEHKLALYGKAQPKNGLSLYGRCIGNGGTPVELESKSFKTCSKKRGYPALVAVDTRLRKVVDGSKLGYNGYVVLKINQETLTLEYYDNQSHLLSEKWISDSASGTIYGEVIEQTTKLTPIDNKTWSDAVSLKQTSFTL